MGPTLSTGINQGGNFLRQMWGGGTGAGRLGAAAGAGRHAAVPESDGLPGMARPGVALPDVALSDVAFLEVDMGAAGWERRTARLERPTELVFVRAATARSGLPGRDTDLSESHPPRRDSAAISTD